MSDLQRDEYDEIKLTRKERAAIHALERLAEKWPETLWLFAGRGGVEVMRYADNGGRMQLPNGDLDLGSACVAVIDIPSDGGAG